MPQSNSAESPSAPQGQSPNKKKKKNKKAGNPQSQTINKNENKITEKVEVTAAKKLKNQFNKKKKQIGQINSNKDKKVDKVPPGGKKNK